jgi:DNA-binding CsgD family transcriptional regulator
METNDSFGTELIVVPPSETIEGPFANAIDGFQIRVLRSIAAGLTDREIAGSLRVSLHRVRYAVRELLAKLSARTRAEAVFVAVTSGLLDRDEAGLDADRPRPSIGSRA